MQDIFRKQNTSSHLVDLYTKCDVYLFQQLFTYEKNIFDRKVTGMTDEKMIHLFGKNKLSFVKSQIPHFAIRILQREYDYIIKPLQDKLNLLASRYDPSKSHQITPAEKVGSTAQKKLDILKRYVLQIKEHYHIQTR